MNTEQHISTEVPQDTPQKVVVAELSGWELIEQTNTLDETTGEKLTVFEAIRADETYDDRLFMVGAQAVFQSMRSEHLSAQARDHNNQVREAKGGSDEYVYAVVSLRPTEAQYKTAVVQRLMSDIGEHSLVFPAI